MTSVSKALWFIENRFGEELSLDQIADAAGISRYQLARAFSAATGRSVMRFVRGRRLTVAARALANGAPDILSIALEAGYGSHEAFTRAFRDQFRVTPEEVRATRCMETLDLVEPITMDDTPTTTLKPPRFETGRPMLIAGLGERYTVESSKAVPSLWQRFVPHYGHIAGQIGNTTYGVCCNHDDDGNFDYIAGVEVSDFTDTPADFTRLRIPEQRYAVFRHDDHISSIRGTVSAIWNRWLPESDYQAADGPDFERYDESFDAETGLGGLEIWIPIKS